MIDDKALIEEALKIADELKLSSTCLLELFLHMDLPDVLKELQELRDERGKPKKPFKWVS